MRKLKIRNWLRVLEGNVIAVPSLEPFSAATNVGNYQHNPYVETILDIDYAYRYISLDKAREAIPEATVVFASNERTKYFFLPEGPPPAGNECPCKNMEDYYQILRDNADVGGSVEEEEPKAPKLGEICRGFSYDLCPGANDV